MLSFFFNRSSKMVLATEAAGLLLLVVAAVRTLSHGASIAVAILLALLLVEYGFLRYCAVHRWYTDAPRGSGIELQFQKAMVPTSYILAIVGLLLFFWRSAALLAIAALLLAVIAHVNVILLFLHRKDRDPTPPNYFSSGAFRKN